MTSLGEGTSVVEQQLANGDHVELGELGELLDGNRAVSRSGPMTTACQAWHIPILK
jgi:hypothetical protein